MKALRFGIGIAVLVVGLSSCAQWNRATNGALIGAGAGGILGAIIGHQAGNTAAGAIIGAAVGGVAGGAIGHYMDKQVEEMQRDLKNAKIERVGEGIKITFNSGILFDVGKSNLSSTAQSNINDLARILNKYKDTNILVEGHTDNTGSRDMNMSLSDNRAGAVARQIKAQGVIGSRVSTNGYGPDQPVEDNGTVDGRAANRRVEVAIFANEKLKKAAQNGTLKS